MKLFKFKNDIAFMKSIYILLFLLILIHSVYAIDELNIFDLIKSEVVLDSNEYIIAIYQDIGSCSKCYNAPMNYIEKLNYKLQNVEFKYLAFVSCLRKKELKLFIDRYKWEGYAIVNKGDVKTNLGIPQNSQITVFNYKYEIIINITDENLHLADSLIYDKIKG